ncbi:MAG TPA: hypothetical protein VNZ53_41490, partial [Steroidobacteraceae bacterium]|nr:hypothetical protein [Steroidobacteraceae bacterium]
MDQRIEAFLADVLALADENPDAIQRTASHGLGRPAARPLHPFGGRAALSTLHGGALPQPRSLTRLSRPGLR